MENSIKVEQKHDGTYAASHNGRVIAKGETQRETIDRARRVEPDPPVLAERVRDTDRGRRDKWRRVY